MEINVTEYGAMGDGITKDTVAIQQAINECSNNGGGKVVFHSGCYLAGTIWLKNNVELHLEHAAELKASPDIKDYNADNAFEQNNVFSEEKVTGAHFIIAHECHNVAITGTGIINGNGSSFFEDVLPENGKNWAIKTVRPGQMVCFCESNKIKIENVSLLDSPYWTLFLHGCSEVMIRGLYIQNPVVRPNGDGIDIDSCDNVTVSDCTIFSGDDGITLRGDNKLLKDKSKACENVTITNCILSTPCNAIRVGVGDGIIKNCIFSNIIVKNTRTGICIISKYSQQQQSGTTIRNIKFSNFIMETIAPFYIASGEGGTASLENIYFSDMRISGERTSLLLGNAANILNSISFKNIEIELSAGSKYMSDEQITAFTREWDKGGNMAFYCVNCNKIKFTDLQVCWSNIDVPWKYALVLERVKNIRISNLDAFPPCSQGENVKKINSENIYISNIFNTKK